MEFNIHFSFDDANNDIKSFFKKEWLSANLVHFGRDISDEINQPLTVTVYNKSSPQQLLGAARCIIMGHTLRVSQLLVIEEYRESYGIGTFILQQLEDFARKNNWHKIRLSTSKTHENIDFYQKNGFVVEATLENDAFQTTWYILSKFIDLQ
ncbi:MAG: GNAT family N-acetyltransferase [Candidatus Hodarchaeales archaeon]|jgi:ribosomal protein S18 acetylase RimI-like enzyme